MTFDPTYFDSTYFEVADAAVDLVNAVGRALRRMRMEAEAAPAATTDPADDEFVAWFM